MLLTTKLATKLYGTPDGDPRGAWAKANIVYCGGGGKAELPAMPGVPRRLWFAVNRRAEPKLRAAFVAAKKACPEYVIGSAGCWVYRHQRHDPQRPLSNHSWGAAVDVDAGNNGGKTIPVTVPTWSPEWYELYPNGLPRAWVDGFLSVGGIGWGGYWGSFVDPMHFEVYAP